MSIVEKAVARLKSLHPEAAADAGTPAEPATTIERLPELQPEARAAELAGRLHVDAADLVRLGLAPADPDTARRLADELRRIKRPLLSHVTSPAVEAPAYPRRIVVTSAMPNEGKTFTAVNLALSLARERDFEVLLVDGDGAKADVTRSLGLEDRIGLMDTLADEHCAPTDVIVATDVANLLVVPSGRQHALATELYASQRMAVVLDQLAARNPRRLLLFDAPPLLATPEAQVLAAHMGQVVMVVAAGRTQRNLVEAALQSLGGNQHIGLVLNMSRLPAADNPYGYGGYYYGRETHDPAAPT